MKRENKVEEATHQATVLVMSNLTDNSIHGLNNPLSVLKVLTMKNIISSTIEKW